MDNEQTLAYLNETIEYYEYQYYLCLDEGEEDEAAEAYKTLYSLYEKRYNIYIEQLRNKERNNLNKFLGLKL